MLFAVTRGTRAAVLVVPEWLKSGFCARSARSARSARA
jgi:hypothetical protein